MKASNIWLHPTVSNPELLADLMLATGMIAVPASATKGIVLVPATDDFTDVDYHTGEQA